MRGKGFYNSSGLADPTAWRALENIGREEKAARVIKRLRALAARHGFELAGRVAVRDARSGKVYR